MLNRNEILIMKILQLFTKSSTPEKPYKFAQYADFKQYIVINDLPHRSLVEFSMPLKSKAFKRLAKTFFNKYQCKFFDSPVVADKPMKTHFIYDATDRELIPVLLPQYFTDEDSLEGLWLYLCNRQLKFTPLSSVIKKD